MKIKLTPRRPNRPLPQHVHMVIARGKEYFYFQIGRSTEFAGPRIKLGDPWCNAEIQDAYRTSGVTYRGGTPTDWAKEVNRVYVSAKGRARIQKMQFGLDRNTIEEMLREQRHSCAISGIYFDPTGYESCHARPFAMSLDRIDSGLGYTSTNVRLVCFIVNVALGQWGLPAVERMAEAISSQRRRKLESERNGKNLGQQGVKQNHQEIEAVQVS